jgi:hypothetical protein
MTRKRYLRCRQRSTNLDEYYGKGFETEVEESVDEGDVEIEEKADWLGDAEGEGADVNQKQDFFSSHSFSFNLRLAPEFGVAGGFVNAKVPNFRR